MNKQPIAVSPEVVRDRRRTRHKGDAFLFWAVGVLVAAVGFSAVAEPSLPPRPLPPFKLTAVTTTSVRTIRNADLLGSVWVADFIFTKCAGPCPMVTARMAELQRALPAGVKLVTFTVDPDRDTVEVLREYAKRVKADPKRWWFVRGSKNALYELFIKGFLLPVVEDPRAPSGERVTHSTKVVLVDREGGIRGYFESGDPDQLVKLRHSAEQRVKAPSPSKR